MKIRWRRASIVILLAAASACAQQPAAPTPQRSAVSIESKDPAAPLRFAAYGDTRGLREGDSRPNHDIHRDIVKGVMSFRPALVLQTGDLVYDGNVKAQWETFDQITGEMRRQIPYYPARGNHDAGTRGYYEQRVIQPVLSGNKLYYSFEKGYVHFVAIDTEQAVEPGSAQGRWLATDLLKAQQKGMFIVPFFHKAMFSVGPHAEESDVLALKAILHPLFQKYGVRLVFEGHDHLYYRTVRDGITYVVTGGGGAPLYDKKHPELEIPGDVFESVNHFCIADVYPDRVKVTAYRRDLSQIDQFDVPVARK